MSTRSLTQAQLGFHFRSLTVLSTTEESEGMRHDAITIPCRICVNVLHVIKQIQAGWRSEVAWMAHNGQNQLTLAVS